MGTRFAAVELLANPERLRADVLAGRMASSAVVLAIPLNDDRGTTFTLPLDYYLVGRNRRKAWDFVRELENFRACRSGDRLKAFERLVNERWATRSTEEWGLMLMFWRAHYGNETDLRQHLSEALAVWLGIDLSWWRPFRDRSWFSRIIGSRLAIRLSTEYRQRIAFEDAVRETRLEAAADIGAPAFVRMALVILSVISGASFGAVVAIGFQSLVGLLDFLFTEWEAERDGLITEDEVEDVTFAGLGILGFQLIQLVLTLGRLEWHWLIFLKAVGEGALQLAAELPDRVEAALVDSHDYVSADYDEDGNAMSVFVVLDT